MTLRYSGRLAVVGLQALGFAAACGGLANRGSGQQEVDGGQSGGGAVAFPEPEPSGGQSEGGALGGGGAAAFPEPEPSGGQSEGGALGGGGQLGGSSGDATGGALACEPDTGRCRGGGLEVCSKDGSGYEFIDCQSQICDQIGVQAQCTDPVCEPGLFCEQQAVRSCNDDRASSSLVEACGPDQYCDHEQLACIDRVCTPSLASCDGSVATTCNADGSGFVGARTDCAQAGKGPDAGFVCLDGACVCPSRWGECSPGRCLDLTFYPSSCGSCDGYCTEGANVLSRRCTDGVCDVRCAYGTKDCNGNPHDGCETDFATDATNCGECGHVCQADAPYCSYGTCVSYFGFKGVAVDLPVAKLTGWTLCYAAGYDDDTTSVATILAQCPQANLMLACRAAHSDTLKNAAYAPREDVVFDTGVGNVTHSANGVGWYFNDDWSWGYVVDGQRVARRRCDNWDLEFGGNFHQRMCWNTVGGMVEPGYSCDAAYDTQSAFWVRLVFGAP